MFAGPQRHSWSRAPSEPIYEIAWLCRHLKHKYASHGDRDFALNPTARLGGVTERAATRIAARQFAFGHGEEWFQSGRDGQTHFGFSVGPALVARQQLRLRELGFAKLRAITGSVARATSRATYANRTNPISGIASSEFRRSQASHNPV